MRYSAGGVTKDTLAAEYGVSRSAVARITPNRWKLTNAQVAELRARYERGEASHRQLAREYGVSSTGVGSILTGQRRAT